MEETGRGGKKLERRRENNEEKKPPKNKEIKRGEKRRKNCLARTVLGIPLFFVYGEGFFGWSEYYLIPMMEVKARKKRELSAEPVGKTHRCISRYIRALGEKHETSTAFNSIHTSLSFSPVSFSPLPCCLERKIRFQKVTKHGRCQ